MDKKPYTREEKKQKISEHFSEIMKVLWLDLNDESLKDTPKRVAKMYVDEIFYWLDESNFPKIMTVNNGENQTVKYDQILLERNIQINSYCEHHFQNIIWKAHIAYIPSKKVIWLSKLNRIADFYARRPQVQERLTEQIFWKLVEELWTDDVAVIIEAEHFCVKVRGVEDPCSDTVTSRLWGRFLQPEARKELFDLISL